jgi:hypothetical protein
LLLLEVGVLGLFLALATRPDGGRSSPMLTSLAALFDVERSVFESEAVELALKLF